MDILEIISEKTTAIALAIVVMYFYNKLVSDVLVERKNIIEALRIERQEWIKTSSHHIETLFEMNRTMAQTAAEGIAAIHMLRNDIARVVLGKGKESGKSNESS